MIHTLVMVTLWLVSLFLAFKGGQINEGLRIRRGLRGVLDGRGLQTRSGRAPGAPRSSSIEEEPLAGQTVSARHPMRNEKPDLRESPSPSVLYDGQAEGALDPRPILSVVEGLEERPGLRVVDS